MSPRLTTFATTCLCLAVWLIVVGDGSVQAGNIRVKIEPSHTGGGGDAAIVQAELAGNPLDRYPHFEFVRAFGEDASVSLAIDPTRFPRIADSTCDLWIMTARSANEWKADRSLETRAVTGPRALTFGVSGIRDNTHPISAPGELSGNAGTRFGAGYDIVLDCNRNRRLDAGDVVDGLGDEAGFYIVRDPALSGPLEVSVLEYSVGTVFDVAPGYTRQMTWFPSAIGTMGRLPLIVISHGNGHDYRWYDYLGIHLASYGYVVMSHENNTEPGIESAASSTLGHTDALLDQQAGIGGGVLDGHLDGSRIVWIGHSRGAEGIVRALDRIFDGHYTPRQYELQDVVLLSSMAPTDFTGENQADPHETTFHLWTAGGDNDVEGDPANDSSNTFHLFERARGFRQSTVIQGSGHEDLHNGPGSGFVGPCHIEPKSEVHRIVRGYMLPLIKHYVDGEPAAKDFLWRQYESLRPNSVPDDPCIVVTHEFRQPESSGTFVIDDFDTEPSRFTSSSGGSVIFDVENMAQRPLRDQDGTFNWAGTDPMNGMTRARPFEPWGGLVFDWSAPAMLEFAVIDGKRDWTRYDYLSFRAAQQTRHPATTAEHGDTHFTVTLRDGDGRASSIDIAAYGGGVEEPYQRDGGWFNEFETVRIRLTDYLHDSNDLHLGDVRAVRFDFGAPFGSAVGRIGLDSLEITVDAQPRVPGSLRLSWPDGLPRVLPPEEAAPLSVRVQAGSESIYPGWVRLFHRSNDRQLFSVVGAVPDGETYRATLPPAGCDDTPQFYFRAVGVRSGAVDLPPGGPDEPLSLPVARIVASFTDDFDQDHGWSARSLGASSGQWHRGVPVDDPGWLYDPVIDADGSGNCWLTQNANGNTDIDGGAVELTSPTFDLSRTDAVVRYAYFLRLTNDNGDDTLIVEVEDARGWTEIARHSSDGGLTWRWVEIERTAMVAAGAVPGADSRLRFTAVDAGTGSIVEAGVDGFEIFHLECH